MDWEEIWWCSSCSEEIDDPEPIYECKNGHIYSRSNSLDGNGRNCPDCRLFGSEIIENGCPNCNSILEKVEAGECPKCREFVLKEDTEDNICPKCGQDFDEEPEPDVDPSKIGFYENEEDKEDDEEENKHDYDEDIDEDMDEDYDDDD